MPELYWAIIIVTLKPTTKVDGTLAPPVPTETKINEIVTHICMYIPKKVKKNATNVIAAKSRFILVHKLSVTGKVVAKSNCYFLCGNTIVY